MWHINIQTARNALTCKTYLGQRETGCTFAPALFRNLRKEWTHGKNMLALWRNSSYLFLSLLTSLIATSCSEDAMVNQNLPFCLATLKQSKLATRWAKISTYRRPDPAPVLPSREEAVSWLQIPPGEPCSPCQSNVKQEGSTARNIHEQQQNRQYVRFV